VATPSAPPQAADAQNAVVRVDPRIADLAEKFLLETRRDAAQVRRALENRDLDQLRLLGHTLRGSASSFGLDYLARLGGLLEHAARNEDVDAAARVAALVAAHLASVELRSG
jgi:HPt (histidine-containing phosphotransfer) domain-containing protein